MSYEGVKYRMIRLSGDLPQDERMEDLRKWCGIYHRKGLAPHYPGGTHGNMSFRIAPGHPAMVITAARSSFAEFMADDAFFTVHAGDPRRMELAISGAPGREPSSEALLHYAIYARRPDVMAILHGHCEPISRHIDLLGLPVTRQAVESGALAIVDSVMEIIDDHSFIEIRDHGFLAMADSINQAGALSMEMLERALSLPNN